MEHMEESEEVPQLRRSRRRGGSEDVPMSLPVPARKSPRRGRGRKAALESESSDAGDVDESHLNSDNNTENFSEQIEHMEEEEIESTNNVETYDESEENNSYHETEAENPASVDDEEEEKEEMETSENVPDYSNDNEESESNSNSASSKSDEEESKQDFTTYENGEESKGETETTKEDDLKEEEVNEEVKSSEENNKEIESEVSNKRKIDEVETENVNGEAELGSNDGSSPNKKPHLDSAIKKQFPDLDKFWLAVEQDPSDFTAWTHLLQFVDQATEISIAREAYDAFLSKYPYCYGYWKKYADYVKRRGSDDEVQEVFNRGLRAIPLSVDLWIHFLNYLKTARQDDPDLIRLHFENAINICGLEFRSDKLWEQYIFWEIETSNLKNAMKIWDILITIPTQTHKKHFEKLIDFINENEPVKILSEEEFTKFSTIEEKDEETAAGEESKENETEKVLDEEGIRAKIIKSRTAVHENTLNEVKIRAAFEDGIKRPYFHVKPVERNQLKNWTDYLKFEIEKGDRKRIITLFERCLIACAMYADYWEKFLNYLTEESPLDVEKIEEVFIRATTIHHPKSLKLALEFAAFEELQGNHEKAGELFDKLISSLTTPALSVYFRHIGFEKRRKNLTRCVELYEKYINELTDKKLAVHLSIKYARFLVYFMSDYEKAINILKDALESSDNNVRSKLLMALIDLGLHAKPIDEEVIIFSLDYGITILDNEDKIKFAQRKLEFLEEHSHDVESIRAAEKEYLSLSKVEAPGSAGSKPTPTGEAFKPPVDGVKSGGGGSYEYSGPSTGGSGSYGPSGGYGGGGGAPPTYPPYSAPPTWSGPPAPPAPSDPSSVYSQSYSTPPPTSWNSYYG